jgi:hypothetical protein
MFVPSISSDGLPLPSILPECNHIIQNYRLPYRAVLLKNLILFGSGGITQYLRTWFMWVPEPY